MPRNSHHVVAIGQAPPPMDGLAYITSCMVTALRQTHAVEFIDISPGLRARNVKYHATRIHRVLRAATALILSTAQSNRVCYMACQSDSGLIYTIFLLGVARICRYPIYLHHHNFGYINQRRKLMVAALAVGGDSTKHIFLCDYMQNRFTATYGSIKHTLTVSNAAFVTPMQQPATSAPELRLGLLSNLNREKGLHLFIALLQAARDRGINLTGILAGPIQTESDLTIVQNAQKSLGASLEYRGPLYNDDKTAFYNAIDIFVFPTTYVNEAQPTVLYEAKSAGNLIVSYDRGCISQQIGEEGLVVAQDDDFITAALRWIASGAPESDQRSAIRASIANNFRKLHVAEKQKVGRLLAPIEAASVSRASI